jgi:hypothetical protein
VLIVRLQTKIYNFSTKENPNKLKEKKEPNLYPKVLILILKHSSNAVLTMSTGPSSNAVLTMSTGPSSNAVLTMSTGPSSNGFVNI